MMTTLRSIHLCFFLQILMLKRQTLSEGHQLFEVNDTEGRNQIFLYSQHCYFAHILAILYYQRDPYTRSTETNSLKKKKCFLTVWMCFQIVNIPPVSPCPFNLAAGDAPANEPVRRCHKTAELSVSACCTFCSKYINRRHYLTVFSLKT